MARTHSKTQVTSGGSVVTQSDIPSDLLSALETSLAQFEPRPGEYTRDQLLAKAGSEYKLKKFFELYKGKIDKRMVGRQVLYYLKA